MQYLDDSNFQQKTMHGNVVVKFTAEWCMPCKALQPAIDSLQDTWRGKVEFWAVNVDRTTVADSVGVTGIPTLLCYKAGMPVKRITGTHDYKYLHQLMSSVYNS